ncbi:MAG: PP2C family serine/threonine-protein phosphatase [Intestinibacter bartlettii]|uniref:PP2C family serine/threonine-protein phosphatase n=1 Tax=Intestinibacter bartlettii TaxID=261299 RepID=UPI0026EC9384|nr:PP2C family serine/threonine-protein phosphatase [Intestinibacter bartlettii]MDO5009677.1 PP2C family serine/threonine-protein phosphatase [Intestinibacter bartlettii]
MEMSVFRGSTVGYKNIIKSSCSQDFSIYEEHEDYLICVVADGHSMERFKYSHIGSKLACQAVLNISRKYSLDKESQIFIDDLKKGEIQRQIKYIWKNLVYNDFYKRNYRAYKMDYILYGKTLTFFIVLKEKIIFFNLGDGNILIKRHDKYEFVFEDNNYKIVNSLVHENCEEKMQYKILDKYEYIRLVLFTDGFINCFNTYSELNLELDKTFALLNKNVFTVLELQNSYQKHLSNLSRYGSYDDISVIFVENTYTENEEE